MAGPTRSTIAIAAFASLMLHAQAADDALRLQPPSEVGKGISGMPLIAEPAGEAGRKINAALRRLDANVRKAAAQCKLDGGEHGSWERTVRVPMLGPGFISYEIVDSTYCGGAHPNISTMSIVYDLRTGAPVDWAALLPPSLTGKLQLVSGPDGTRMVSLSGKTLYALYLTGYRQRTGETEKDASDDECREAVAEAGSGPTVPGMMAWLDAKQAGLVVQFDLPHVVQACADPVAIPAAALRAIGSQSALVDALTKARAGSSKGR